MMLIDTVLLVFIILSVSVQTLAIKSSKPSSQFLNNQRDGNVETYSITPSFSYQYHTNDHGDYEPDIVNTGATRNREKENKNNSKTNKLIQWDDFAQASDPKFSYADAIPVQMENYAPQPVTIPIDSYGSPSMSRESYNPPPGLMDMYGTPYGASTYQGGASPVIHGGGGPSGGGGGAVVTAEAAPPTIKGSIDYVLIPLILIGIAGPIFVVLYVVLGAFEAKLAPITTRSLTWTDAFTNSFETLEPATDILFATLSKALDQHQCMERTMCHMGSFGRLLGLQRLAFLNQTMEAVTSEPYKRPLRMLLSSMINKPESCSAFKCP